jgi:hypothetical protein
MPKTLQRSTITRSLAAAATAVAIAAVGATPASAWPVDHPLITGGDIQFGRGWNGAAPAAGGNLNWDVDQVSGIVTPRLNGNIFALNSDGYEVRVRMTYYNAAQNQIGLRHSGWQGPATGNIVDTATGLNVFHIVGLNTFGASDVYGVTVEVQRRIGGAAGVVERLGSVDEKI